MVCMAAMALSILVNERDHYLGVMLGKYLLSDRMDLKIVVL